MPLMIPAKSKNVGEVPEQIHAIQTMTLWRVIWTELSSGERLRAIVRPTRRLLLENVFVIPPYELDQLWSQHAA